MDGFVTRRSAPGSPSAHMPEKHLNLGDSVHTSIGAVEAGLECSSFHKPSHRASASSTFGNDSWPTRIAFMNSVSTSLATR
ncbi:MAG: hypothetical protein EOO65_00130 [Methanosarcinales archaeon]|nr:MAG: hypothetical protein EOO65_00130 [Methanosarcinales archaeon]